MSEQPNGWWIEHDDGSKQFGKHVDRYDNHAIWVEPPAELGELIVEQIQQEALETAE
jgi:hypothetical protein